MTPSHNFYMVHAAVKQAHTGIVRKDLTVSGKSVVCVVMEVFFPQFYRQHDDTRLSVQLITNSAICLWAVKKDIFYDSFYDSLNVPDSDWCLDMRRVTRMNAVWRL